MSTTEINQCPNCWGYQEYDQSQPDRILCECPKENN